MKRQLFITAALAASCTACSPMAELNSVVSESTASIEQNTKTVNRSTETIEENYELIQQSTEGLKKNRKALEMIQ